MTSYDAWLDTEEVKRLAGRLLDPVPSAPAAPSGDPSFGADFVGFAAEEPAAKVETIPLSGLDELVRRFGRAGLFVLDASGETILVEGEGARFTCLAADFARASTPTTRVVRLKVDALRWLELVPVGAAETRRVIGAIVSEPLDAETLAAIQALDDDCAASR